MELFLYGLLLIGVGAILISFALLPNDNGKNELFTKNIMDDDDEEERKD